LIGIEDADQNAARGTQATVKNGRFVPQKSARPIVQSPRKGRRKISATLTSVPALEPTAGICFVPQAGRRISIRRPYVGENAMSLGLILIIILILFLLGGFSGRFGGYGYGMGHSGMGLGGVILVVLNILLLLGKL